MEGKVLRGDGAVICARTMGAMFKMPAVPIYPLILKRHTLAYPWHEGREGLAMLLG